MEGEVNPEFELFFFIASLGSNQGEHCLCLLSLCADYLLLGLLSFMLGSKVVRFLLLYAGVFFLRVFGIGCLVQPLCWVCFSFLLWGLGLIHLYSFEAPVWWLL